MIARIHVDNYRCLTNFTFAPPPRTLLPGPNGSGKTTLLEAVEAIVALAVHGAEVKDVFPSGTLTRWDRREHQRFELDVHVGEGEYRFVLVVAHDRERERIRIHEDRVERDGCILFRYEGGRVHLHRNDGTEGTSFPFGGGRSFLPEIEVRPEAEHPGTLLDHLSNVRFLKLTPSTMTSRAATEDEPLDPDGANFAAWYRHLHQEDPDRVSTYLQRMRDVEVLQGFRVLDLVRAGTRIRELVAAFELSGKTCELNFEELSDGQRALFVLYALLPWLEARPRTLLVDEPGNYLALSEIEPWLPELDEALGDEGQVIVASHNPEVIDHLAADSPFWFERPDGGPVRVREAVFDRETGAKASEQLAGRTLDGPSAPDARAELERLAP